MSVEREVDVELDLEANAGEAVVVERRGLTLDELFQDGELRLWEDGAGWSGYRREEDEDGEVAYFWVNTRHDTDSWVDHIRVGERAVREGVRKHIEDPDAGGAGRFVRGCSPP